MGLFSFKGFSARGALLPLPVSAALGMFRSSKGEHCFHKCSEEPQFGGVIFCNRKMGLYRHFGIYIGDGKVIHYAAQNGDMDKDEEKVSVHETTLAHFREGDDLYEMDFSRDYKYCRVWRYIVRSHNYELQSPEQTVLRAKSRLGETEYNLVSNNCEHFALWCKTNVSESKQVDNLLDLFLPMI